MRPGGTSFTQRGSRPWTRRSARSFRCSEVLGPESPQLPTGGLGTEGALWGLRSVDPEGVAGLLLASASSALPGEGPCAPRGRKGARAERQACPESRRWRRAPGAATREGQDAAQKGRRLGMAIFFP